MMAGQTIVVSAAINDFFTAPLLVTLPSGVAAPVSWLGVGCIHLRIPVFGISVP
jgi:hypothetical protein